MNDPDIAATDTDGSQLEGGGSLDCQLRSVTHLCFSRIFIYQYIGPRICGRKIYTIGTQGFQDVMEEGVATLDFVSQAKLGKHIALTLKARNLLNPSYQLSRKANGSGQKVILGDYKKGINVSLGVSCTF